MLECPKVTVLMSVFNGEQYLREAIESILNQTYEDFEFLIINDASTDSSRSIIASYKDSRIRLIDNETNRGLTVSLNRGLELALGEYIARMDCDDISLPDRLKKQVAFMDHYTEVAICGTWVEFFGIRNFIWKYPIRHNELITHLYFKNLLAHSSVILRKNILQIYNLKYNPEFFYAQDYDLWTRCAKHVQLANIPEVLVRYRKSENQISCYQKSRQTELADCIRIRQLADLGLELSEENYELHKNIALNRFQPSTEFIIKSEKWLSLFLKLLYCPDKINLHGDKRIVADVIADKWFAICNNARTLGLWVCYRYVCSHLKGASKIKFMKRTLYIFIKCIVRKN